MRGLQRLIIPVFVALFLSACVPPSGGPSSGSGPGIPEDQQPMYGGMDRTRFRQVDDRLIQSGIEIAGSRQAASRAWVERAMTYFQAGNSQMAMRRLNQAWLLDSKNAEVYWRFGIILRDRKDTAGARTMMKRAHSLGLRDAGFIRDYQSIVGNGYPG